MAADGQVETDRITTLNDRPVVEGRYVLYWMQQSQRASFNPALEQAILVANERGLPVVVGFGLTAGYPDANRRHYAFMLQGLKETSAALTERGIGFAMRLGAPDEVAIGLAEDAALVVCDRGYLRHQRAWRNSVAQRAPCRVIEVEGDVVVPVDVASRKREYAARTIRPKIERLRDDFLRPLPENQPQCRADTLTFSEALDLSRIDDLLDRLKLDGRVACVRRFHGGTSEARRRLDAFLGPKFATYEDGRAEPASDHVSGLSPYLHFGQISPVEIALAASNAEGEAESRIKFLEELIVRRELAANFVHFSPDYDQYGTLPDWAQNTLEKHRDDERQHLYDAETLEAAQTHDRYWNAAMREMTATGYMHNTMRMYWGKKILEWSETPEQAFATALTLNNRYFLDGRDPNSYTNVAWCFGLHDRPWAERPIFGTVRYMNDRGLERKYDMKAYLSLVDRLVAEEGA
mgnify:CR=1 FL=1